MATPHITIESLGPQNVPTIFGIGRNYADHAKELQNPVPQGEPVVFLKAPSSIRKLEEGALAFETDTFHHEIELVIRLHASHPLHSKLDWNTVDSIGLGLDMTRRETQNKLKASGLPWTTAKSFAGSALLSEFIPKSLWQNQTEFEFKLMVNNELRQTGNTKQMLFDVPFILTWLSSFNVLQAGDLIFTGTPAGVGPMKKGDRFSLELAKPERKWDGVL